MLTSKLRLVILLGLILMALSPALSRAESPIEEADCNFDGPEGHEMFCGYITLPERRGTSSERTIRLYFAQISTRSAMPAQPIIYLEGGPGGSGTYYDTWMDVLLKNHDLILLDQRGTGYSEPTLNCPEIEQAGGENDGEAQKACRARLVNEGIDLSAYNSAESAADIDELRRSLGIEKWTLYGISYGTRLALTIMRDHPEGVQTAIIDGVYPPQVNAFEEEGPNGLKAFNVLFDGCAADVRCARAFPKLRENFYETVARLDADPATYQATDPETGDKSESTLDGNTLVDRLFQALYNTSIIPMLPSALDAASAGDYEEMDALFSGSEGARRGYQGEGEDVSDSEGMNFSVECREEWPFNDKAKALKALDTAPEQLRDYLLGQVENGWTQCEVWNVEKADAIETQPVRSSIPTLVLSGEYDPVTPAAWGKVAADALDTAYNFTFPGVGHGAVDTSPCANQIIEAFLADPNAAPNGGCIEQLPSPDFEVPNR